MSISYARVSRISESCPKDFNFQFFMYQSEAEYSSWLTKDRIVNWIYALPESVVWNGVICAYALLCVVMVSTDLDIGTEVLTFPVTSIIDLLYNVLYAVFTFAKLAYDWYRMKHDDLVFKFYDTLGYVIDLLSFVHYATLLINDNGICYIIKITCYYMRLHTPLRFLWNLLEYNLRGNVFLTLLKYIYIFTLMRVLYVNFFIWIKALNMNMVNYTNVPHWLNNSRMMLFFRSFYVIDKYFLPIGPDTSPQNDSQRVLALVLMLSGSLIVTGTTIASLSLIMGLYMRPEAVFRARFTIIMSDLTKLPVSLSDKVTTFYRMYWHKQKAVSVTRLLKVFPPALTNALNTDIYFEGQQKSRILADLSYSFLSEVAKKMETVNYVPGDTIISRNSFKNKIIYIMYGDVEMLTAEDDETAILRFTRGTIMNPSGGCVEVACSKAHVGIRAATFCTAHILHASDLWRVTAKYGRVNGQNYILHSSFQEHFGKVMRHYLGREHHPNKYKSSIMMLKRNLIELKEARDDQGHLLMGRTDAFIDIAGCYTMRNHRGTSLTGDSDAICLRPTFPCILQPSSSLLIAWKIFVSLFTVAVVFIHPLQLVFIKTISRQFILFNHFGTFLYIVDIIVSLSIGTNIEEGVPITFTHTSAKQLKSIWFLVDLVSVMPLFEFFGDGRLAGLNKIIKLFSVFHLMKHMEAVNLHHSMSLRYLAYVLLMVSMIYLLASVQQGYSCFVQGCCRVTNITHDPYWAYAPLSDVVTNRLAVSLYWSTSMLTFTTHKTADSAINSWNSQAFLLIVLELCTVFQILIQSVYSATIMVNSHMRDEYVMCIDTVKGFLMKNNVDPTLQHRFITYLKLCWFTDKAYSITNEKKSILFDLPSHVYQDILELQRSKYIVSVPLCKHIHSEILRKLSSQARLFYTSPNEILQNTGDITNEIYVISKGTCEVLNPISKESVKLLSVKDYFGDVECLLRIPAFYTVRAVTHVHVYSISRKILQEAISTPKITETIIKTKKSQLYVQANIRREQFLTYQKPSESPNRSFFPKPRKHETDAAFLQPFSGLGFFSILRYVFPRFTVRPDGKYLKRYEWFRAACAVLSAIIYPMYTVIILQLPWMDSFTQCLDCFAYADIIQRTLVAYFNDQGILVYHPASTLAHYFRGAFIVDLLSSLPLELLDSVRNKIYYRDNAYRIPSTGQYYMFNRVGQLYRVPNALDILNDFTDRQDIILLIKALPFFLCILIIITSFLIEHSVTKWSVIGGGWRLEPIISVHGTWIHFHGHRVGYNITDTPVNLALTTFYWAVYELTTTGFNLFQPNSVIMLNIIILGMLIGAMFLTYFSVKVISIRANVNSALATYQAHMSDMKNFMKKESVSKLLQKEITLYYEYKWDKTCGTDYRTVLKLCEQITLRTDTIVHIYGQTFSKCPILYKSDISLLRVMGRALYGVHYRAGTTIIEQDEVISKLYIIDYGTIAVYDDTIVTTKLPRGSMFGNLGNVETSLSVNRFVASANVNLLEIDAVTFYNIIADFPSAKVLMLKFRPNEENYIIGSLEDQGVVLSTWKDSRDEAADKQRQGFFKHFHVMSTGVQIYLMIISLASCYGDMYNAGFQINQKFIFAILYALDFLYLIKIFLYFYFPYISDEDWEKENALQAARKIYLKGEFRYDLLSMLPLEMFCLLHNDPWSIFAFARLNRLFRIVTVSSCLGSYYQRLSTNLYINTVLTVIIWFTLFTHAMACILYYISIFEESRVPYSSWRFDSEGKGQCGYNYLCSLYFVGSTFTLNGIGDILPRKQSEVAFVSILMICSTMIYMIFVGEFSNIFQYEYFPGFKYYTMFLELQEFLKNTRVSPNLATITKNYTLHLWQASRGIQLPHFVECAPQCLRLKVMSSAYMEHLSKHPVFQYCEPAFLRHLVGFFRPFLYSEKMWILKEGEITNAMYFVHRGYIKELDEDTQEVQQIYNAGMYFGTMRGLVRDMPFSYSYKTIIKSQVLALCLDDWEYLLEHFPISRRALFKDGADSKDSKNKKKVQVAGKSTVKLESQKKSSKSDLEAKKTSKSTTSPTDASKGKHRLRSSLAAIRPLAKLDASPKPTDQQLKARRASVRIRTDDELATPAPLKEDDSSPWPLESRNRSFESITSETEPVTPWPMDSRKISEEAEPPKHDFGRRKSAVYDTDKAATAKELETIKSTQDLKLDKDIIELKQLSGDIRPEPPTEMNYEESIPSEKTGQPSQQEIVTKLKPDYPVKELSDIKIKDVSPWPLDSRKLSDIDIEANKGELDEHERSRTEIAKPEELSTAENRNQDIKASALAIHEHESYPWPVDSRKFSIEREVDYKLGKNKDLERSSKSSVHSIDKEARPLDDIKSPAESTSRQQPETRPPDDQLYLRPPSQRQFETSSVDTNLRPPSENQLETALINADLGSTEPTKNEKVSIAPTRSIAVIIPETKSKDEESVIDPELAEASKASLSEADDKSQPKKLKAEDIKDRRSIMWYPTNEVRNIDDDKTTQEEAIVEVHSIPSTVSDVKTPSDANLEPKTPSATSAASSGSGSLWSTPARGIEDDYYDPAKSTKKGNVKSTETTESSTDDYESRIAKESRKRRSSGDREGGFWKRRRRRSPHKLSTAAVTVTIPIKR